MKDDLKTRVIQGIVEVLLYSFLLLANILMIREIISWWIK